MFNLFRKKKDAWEEIFKEEERRFYADIFPIFQAVASRLPEKYNHLKDRFIPDLLRGCKPNLMKGSGELYVFLIDQLSHKKYETEKNNYLIQNIKLFSIVTNKYEKLELHIHNNIPTAFLFSTSDWRFDLSNIDTSEIREFHYNDPEFQNWSKIMGNIPLEHQGHFDLISGFEIDLDNSRFFTIKELGDGDYIAIKENGSIYGLIHGRNIIEKLFDTPQQLYEALEKKQFSFKQYYNSRT